MGMIVARLKAGGSWDALVGRFCWWALDGPPIMEQLLEPVLDRTVPSIEQLALAASFIRNCSLRYDDPGLARVVEWGNSIRQKSRITWDLTLSLCVYRLRAAPKSAFVCITWKNCVSCSSVRRIHSNDRAWIRNVW